MTERRAGTCLRECYYETLGVPFEASDEDLRKAYKIMALKWHPDKNPDDPELASVRFQEVQAAYDVLSDQRERAWYDRHREEILKNRKDGIIDDKSFDVMPFCLSSCYSGFGDDDNSFYSVYKRVFDELIKEELPYLDEETSKYPGFGDKTSSVDEVHEFYSFWTGFSTRKTFDYIKKYETLEAPNRRTLREMEKHNNKMREAAKKSRNQEIRQLVAFVKRRDKRVVERKKQLNSVAEENRKKTQENILKQMKERKQKIDSEVFTESEWASMSSLEKSLKRLERDYDRKHQKQKRNLKDDLDAAAAAESSENDSDDEQNLPENDTQNSHLTENDGDKKENGTTSPKTNDVQIDEDDDDGESDQLFCIACQKSFKSVKSFENHEKSKKHKVNLAHLKKDLEEEEQSIT